MANKSNTTPSGYLDRYDRDDKDWKKVLFRPGMIVQSSEMNEVQSIINSEMQQVGNVILGEGTVIDGGNIVVNNVTKIVTVEPGKFYYLGYTHEFQKMTIPMTGVGEERLGLRATPVSIDELEDPDLLDNALGSDAYQKPGAHRLKYVYSLAINDNNTTLIAVITDGNLTSTFNRVLPLLTPIMKVLAQRTYETSGNYTADKYSIKIEDITDIESKVDTHLRAIIKNGISYVLGWRSQNFVNVQLLERPASTADRLDEPRTYINNVNYYEMSEYPVRFVTGVMALVRTDTPVSSGTSDPFLTFVRGSVVGGRDEIPESVQPVYALFRVWDALHGDYIIGTDCMLYNGTSVDWSLGGAQPDPGETYYVVLDYSRQMVKGKRTLVNVDLESVVRGSGDDDTLAHNGLESITSVVQGVQEYFEGTHFTVSLKSGVITWGVTRPTGTYSVTYSYWSKTVEGDYLGRDCFVNSQNEPLLDKTPNYAFNSNDAIDYKKHITFDTTGAKPIPGQIAYYTYKHTLPRNDSVVVDSTGYITVLQGAPSEAPKAPQPSSSQMRLFNLRMPPEARAADVVVEPTENQRLTMEELRLMLSEIDNLRYNQAVFQLAADAASMQTATDKIGVFADNFATPEFMDLGNTQFDCSFDSIFRQVELGQTGEQIMLVNSSVNWVESDTLLYKPFTETVVAVQPYATHTIQVNPYGFANVNKKIELNPSFDRFNIDKTVMDTALLWHNEGHAFFMKHTEFLTWLRTTPRPRPPIPESLMTPQVIDELKKIYGSNYMANMNAYNRNTWSEEVYTNLQTTPSFYARERDVDVSGSGWASADILSLSFDGRYLPFTATGITAQISTDRIQVNPDGTFTAKFTVPNMTVAGTHTVTVHSSFPTAPNIVQRAYRSEGVITTGTKTIKFFLCDPLAETFTFDEDFYLTSIQLFFASSIAGNIVQVHIVKAENGIPTSECYATAEVDSSTIVPVPMNNTGNGTKFTFSQPVKIEKGRDYAFIVKVDDPAFVLYRCVLGYTDPVNGVVAKQPFSGVLLSSANMQTWSAHQTSDLKFVMNRASFSTNDYTVQFNEVVFSSQVSRFTMSIRSQDTDAGAYVKWQYTIGNSGNWKAFEPGLEVDTKTQFTNMTIRAIMTGTERMSPVIFNGAYVIGYMYKSTGSYIARRYELPNQDARYVDVYMYQYVPSNTQLEPVVQLDGDGVWRSMVEVPADRRQIDQKFWEYHYIYDTGSNSTLVQKIHCRVNMTTFDKTKSPAIRKFRSLARAI